MIASDHPHCRRAAYAAGFVAAGWLVGLAAVFVVLLVGPDLDDEFWTV